MSPIYRDETYSDLVWVKFEGPTWNEFHELMSALEVWTAEAQEPFYMVFYPTIDMPKGSPLPHIRRMIKFISDEPKVRHMITIMPKRMVIAKVFADVTTRLFPNQMIQATIITDSNEVYRAYEDIVGKMQS